MFMMLIVIVISIPIGVASAIYLEEFAPKNMMTDIIEGVNAVLNPGKPKINWFAPDPEAVAAVHISNGKYDKASSNSKVLYGGEISDNELKDIKDAIPSIDKQNGPALEAIVDSLHEKVEAEPTDEKRAYFRRYLKSTLKNPVTTDFDERKFFLNSLDEMTLLECELLAFLTKNGPTQVGTLSKPGVEQYAIVGAIGRLKSRGFVATTQNSFAIGGGADNSLQEIASVSAFGAKFHAFCIAP